MLHGGHQHDLNMRGAYLHLAADALGSIAAIIAAALIALYGWTWADPVAGLAGHIQESFKPHSLHCARAGASRSGILRGCAVPR